MGLYTEVKHRAWEANMALASSGLVMQTFGNASAADHDRGVFAIKPSGVPYDDLAPGLMVVVGFDGTVVEGKLRPSSDTPTHAVLYRAFCGIGGIVHTHSPACDGVGAGHAFHSPAWDDSCRPLAGASSCTAMMDDESIRGDYEVETGNMIVKAFRDLSPSEIEMVLVAGHGPFTWGATPEKAVYNSIMLEEIARMASLTLAINPQTQSLQQSLIDRHYYRKHGDNAYYGN